MAAIVLASVSLSLATATSAQQSQAPPAAAAPAAPTLAGTSWIIDTGGRLPADQSPSIAFAGTGAVSGFAGCNTYGGSHLQTGSKIAITDIALQFKTCGDMVMIREASFLNALKHAARFEITAGKLTLISEGGTALQTFVKR